MILADTCAFDSDEIEIRTIHQMVTKEISGQNLGMPTHLTF